MIIELVSHSTNINPRNRGLNYGDGFFSTGKISNSKLELIDKHLARLETSANHLGFTDFDVDQLAAFFTHLSLPLFGVGKILVTRDGDVRGYGIGQKQTTRVFIFIEPKESDWFDSSAQRMIICKTNASINPSLSKIKHLNRLDNVLARNEVVAQNADEGVMVATKYCEQQLTPQQFVVSATQANIFAFIDGCFVTPKLEAYGVQGIIRNLILENFNDCPVIARDLYLSELAQADAIVLTNCLRGVVPVNFLEDKQLIGSEIAESLSTWLNKNKHD